MLKAILLLLFTCLLFVRSTLSFQDFILCTTNLSAAGPQDHSHPIPPVSKVPADDSEDRGSPSESQTPDYLQRIRKIISDFMLQFESLPNSLRGWLQNYDCRNRLPAESQSSNCPDGVPGEMIGIQDSGSESGPITPIQEDLPRVDKNIFANDSPDTVGWAACTSESNRIQL